MKVGAVRPVGQRANALALVSRESGHFIGDDELRERIVAVVAETNCVDHVVAGARGGQIDSFDQLQIAVLLDFGDVLSGQNGVGQRRDAIFGRVVSGAHADGVLRAGRGVGGREFLNQDAHQRAAAARVDVGLRDRHRRQCAASVFCAIQNAVAVGIAQNDAGEIQARRRRGTIGGESDGAGRIGGEDVREESRSARCKYLHVVIGESRALNVAEIQACVRRARDCGEDSAIGSARISAAAVADRRAGRNIGGRIDFGNANRASGHEQNVVAIGVGLRRRNNRVARVLCVDVTPAMPFSPLRRAPSLLMPPLKPFL